MVDKILPFTGVDDGLPRIRVEQEAAIQRMCAEPTHGVLLADVPGKGKTLQISEVVIRLGLKRVLYVCLPNTHDQWRLRLAAQSDGAIQLRQMDSTKAGRQAFADFLAGADGHYVCSPQWLTAQDWRHDKVFTPEGKPVWKIKKSTGERIVKPSKEIGPRLVPAQESERIHLRTYKKIRQVDGFVFDESHVVQSKTSIIRKTIATIPRDWLMLASGTFYGNKVSGMWSPTRLLWPDLVPPSYRRWEAEWLETKTVYLPGGKTAQEVVGERREGAFIETLPCFLRQEDEEKVPAPNVVRVELTEAQREQYLSLELDLVAWIDAHAGGKAPLVAELPIVLRQRLRTATLAEMIFDENGNIGFSMESKSSKLMALRGILDGWAGQPVLILTDSKRFAKVTVARMRRAGYGAVEWSGDVSKARRAEIKARFVAEDPDYRYIVGVIPALSTGVDNLQSACSKIVWLSQSEDMTQGLQAVARIFRQGMTTKYGPFEHTIIAAKDTLDEQVFSSLLAQRLSLEGTLRVAA